MVTSGGRIGTQHEKDWGKSRPNKRRAAEIFGEAEMSELQNCRVGGCVCKANVDAGGGLGGLGEDKRGRKGRERPGADRGASGRVGGRTLEGETEISGPLKSLQ